MCVKEKFSTDAKSTNHACIQEVFRWTREVVFLHILHLAWRGKTAFFGLHFVKLLYGISGKTRVTSTKHLRLRFRPSEDERLERLRKEMKNWNNCMLFHIWRHNTNRAVHEKKLWFIVHCTHHRIVYRIIEYNAKWLHCSSAPHDFEDAIRSNRTEPDYQ